VSGNTVTLRLLEAEAAGEPTTLPTDAPDTVAGTIIENGNAIRLDLLGDPAVFERI
jgi:hypothetical protein